MLNDRNRLAIFTLEFFILPHFCHNNLFIFNLNKY